MKSHDITITINDSVCSVQVEPRMTLLDCLRDILKLTGTHMGCEHGVCGACSVTLNGEAIRSCLMLAVQANGKNIRTVEGLCAEDGSPGILQNAFQDAHGLQCGYCTPGMLMSADALLRVTPDPTIQEISDAIGGNICRCTGYKQIIDSILLAGSRLRENSP